MISRRKGLLGLATLLGSPGFTAAAVNASESPLVIPLQRVGDAVWIAATLNGVGPLNVLVGFLGDASQLPNTIAKRAKLQQQFKVDIAVDGEESRADLYQANKVVLGGVLTVSPAVFIGMRRWEHWFDAAISLNFVQGSFGFDFETNTLTFLRHMPDLTGYEIVKRAKQGDDRLRPDNVARIVAELDGERINLGISTENSSGLLLTSEYVHRRKLWERPGRFVSWTRSSAGGHSTEHRVTRLGELKIGGASMSGPVASLPHPRPGPADTLTDGYIGMEVLRRFGFWVCDGRQTIGFRPNMNVGQAFAYDRSGFSTWSDGNSVITQVMPGGPAEKAGLRPGDVVAPDADFLHRIRLEAALRGSPGSIVTVELQRDGSALSRDLLLEELV
jgi:hypothetical protein